MIDSYLHISTTAVQLYQILAESPMVNSHSRSLAPWYLNTAAFYDSMEARTFGAAIPLSTPLVAFVQFCATSKISFQFFIDKTTRTGSSIGSYLRFDYSSDLGSPINISGKTAGIAHLTTNLDFYKYLKEDESFARKNMTGSDAEKSIISKTRNTEANEVWINHWA